ncbi:MAG: adenylate/guanylate cyclase domain-containing protein [Bauldia sp.]
MDITRWLDGLALGKYADAFRQHGVDGEVLPRLTADDLREIGVVAIGDRRKLLDAIAGLAPSPATIAPLPEGEKRQVSILFADLVGSTALANELGSEGMHGLLQSYFDALDSIVDSYGGHVDKHIGDAVMGVFGAPVAHGNDIERATRAALAIREAMTTLTAKVGRLLRVHVAVAAGDVVASSTGSAKHSEYTVIGDAVNLAARLLERAPADEVFISDAVRRGLGARAAVDDVGILPIKGLPKPEQVWRLLALSEAIERPPITGRRVELGMVEAAMTACRDLGRGQVVYIRGEAGIGKTRVVEAIEASAGHAGFAVHHVQVRDFGTSADRDPISALTRSLLMLGAADGPDAVTAAAGRTVETGLADREDAVFLQDLLGIVPTGEQAEVFGAMEPVTRETRKRETLGELVRRLSMQTPALIAVEDLHLADAVSLSRIGDLAGIVTACPALLVATSRIEGDPLDGSFRSELRQATLTIVELGPLSLTEATSLARAEGIEAEGEAAALVARAGGNPLFLEQLVRGVRETGLTELPPTAKSVILARLDMLDPTDKKAIQAASVLGQRFTIDALRHLIGAPDYDCGRLLRHHLVQPDGGELVFAHALVREGINGSLLGKRKQELHRQAAEWFADRDPLTFADHLAGAGDPRAAAAYLAAARGEAAAYRDQRALQLAERGAALAQSRADIYGLTILRGELLYALWRIPEAKAAHELAVSAADGKADRARAVLGIAECLRIEDHLDRALTVLAEAEGLALEERRDDLLSRISYLRGNLYFALGEIELCLKSHEAALDHARKAQSPELEAQAAGGLGDAEYARGRFLTANRYFRQSVELARAHGLRRVEAANYAMVAYTDFIDKSMRIVLDEARAALELTARVGHQRALLIARGGLFLGLFETGDLMAAKAAAEQLLEDGRKLGTIRFEGQGLTLLGQVYLATNELTKAREIFQRALDATRQIGFRAFGPPILAGLAATTSDASERQRLMDDGEAALDTSLSHNVGFFYRSAIDEALSRGDWADVDRFAASYERRERPEPFPWMDFIIARGRVLARYGRGERSPGLLRDLRFVAETADQLCARLAGGAVHAAIADLEQAIAPAGQAERILVRNPIER